MTDDFQLFGGDDSDAESNVSLVTAYLARELSPAQILAIEERLATDRAFRAEVTPVLDAWSASYEAVGQSGGRPAVVPRSWVSSAADRAAGWQRYLEEASAAVEATPSRDNAVRIGAIHPAGPLEGGGLPRVTRPRRMRIAAALLVAALPVLGIAQAIRYVRARNASATASPTGDASQPPSRRSSISALGPPESSEEGLPLSHLAEPQQPGIPAIHGIGLKTGESAPFVNVSEVRQLSDGRLLVNDAGARRLVLLDSALAHPRIVLDTSASATTRRYPVAGSLIPFTGDSTLFVDRSARAFVWIDPRGEIVRVTALPPVSRLPLATSRLDGRGRLIFEDMGIYSPPIMLTTGRVGHQGFNYWYWRLYAHDFGLRSIDTVIEIQSDTQFVRSGVVGAPPSPPRSIFPVVDGWGVMSDGTIAIVHGRDYRIEWRTIDGATASSARIPHEWRHLSDAEKQVLADSLTRHRDSIKASPRSAPIDVAAIPDYLPAIGPGTRADADNLLWIPLHETMVTPPGTVYDIVDRSGKLVDRVRVTSPIVGFGRGGVVYLAVHDAGTVRVERMSYWRPARSWRVPA